MIIGKECLFQLQDELIIENYPKLEKIIVKKNSLKYIDLLQICNNERLKTIEIKDGEIVEKNGYTSNTGAFKRVNQVILESICLSVFDNNIFLIYNHSLLEIMHSMKKQEVYLCRVI